MADNQQQQSSQQPQQQQQQQVTAVAQQQQQQQTVQRQVSQTSVAQSQASGQVSTPQAIQPQPQQNIQPQPQQQSIQPQQQSQQQNVQQQQQQQQTIQQLPQLQQIAPQQQQHLLPNLQTITSLPNLQTMTSVPLSMAMAGNAMNGGMTTTNLRPQLAQLPQVQVIHQAMHSPSFMPQFAYNQQQQLMLQNMQAMQANVMSMNPQQINMANMVAMQGRPNTGMFTPAAAAQTPTTPTTPNIMNISSGSNTLVTSSSTASTNAVKPTISNVAKQQSSQSTQQQQQQQQQQQSNIQQQNQGQQQQQQQLHALNQVQQAQATAMIGGKPIILGQAGSLLQGQIGVISAGQLQTTQAYATGQTFGQIQSKPGQQISMATNSGQGQVQLNSSQSPMRFSQPQLLVSNAGNAQLISSQPVFTNQMLQAMSQLQHYPQQPMISAQGQTPTIISGQGLYIRSANPVQAQGLVTGVQTAMNSNFKNPNQQTLQTVAVPIQKQTTAAQTGKVLLPSVSKPVTAKVPPTSMTGTAKTGTQTMPKPKGRPKGTGKSSPAVTVTATNQVKSDPVQSPSKPSTPTISLPIFGSHDNKSQSDSEVERKSTNEEAPSEDIDISAGSEKIEAKQIEMEVKEVPVVVELDHKPVSIPDHPVEKQRAIVKPHILTHVIEGFVIQEGPEPFPVQRSSLLTEFIPPKPGQPVEQSSLISMDEADMEDDDDTSHEEQGPLMGQKSLRCEYCSSIYNSSNSAQRFCSKSCAKRYNVGCTKRLHHFPGRPKDKGGRILKRKRKGKKGWHGNRLQSSSSMGAADVDMDDQSSSLSQEDTPSPSTSPDHNLQTPPPELQMEGEYIQPLTSPTKWNVMEVYEFIKNLPGCGMYAEEFRSQEIDGQALLLLKEDHLMTTMNMKLGPALKICARINTIKEETG
ncbi:polyhomeotic-like protein 2 isoform X2 [Ruditapes philippinarum]|uniref:polyhomeotic-like protein 2 isoform X2 n=1 Tax=Ruditapes philippinarum TaxID=129788 RepID=UPI00295C06D3|nr:polyhomeotic-like protein 2 isoform X2 [Ruditapes philippinarum]